MEPSGAECDDGQCPGGIRAHAGRFPWHAALTFVRRPTADDTARVDRLADPCAGISRSDERWTACVKGAAEHAGQTMRESFRAALQAVQHNARAVEKLGFNQIGENARRNSVCGGPLAEVEAGDPMDHEAMYCHARMMASRDMALDRYSGR